MLAYIFVSELFLAPKSELHEYSHQLMCECEKQKQKQKPFPPRLLLNVIYCYLLSGGEVVIKFQYNLWPVLQDIPRYIQGAFFKPNSKVLLLMNIFFTFSKNFQNCICVFLKKVQLQISFVFSFLYFFSVFIFSTSTYLFLFFVFS